MGVCPDRVGTTFMQELPRRGLLGNWASGIRAENTELRSREKGDHGWGSFTQSPSLGIKKVLLRYVQGGVAQLIVRSRERAGQGTHVPDAPGG